MRSLITQYLALSIICLVLMLCVTPAFTDDFIGTWDFDFYSDTNIQDGVSIEQGYDTVTASRPDPQHVTLNRGGSEVTLLQDDDILRIESPPFDDGTGFWLAAYAMADGVNAAWVNIGQEYNDPDDISVMVGLAGRGTSPVSAADLVGYWSIDFFEQYNLRNILTEPFIRSSDVVHLADLGGDLIQVDFLSYNSGAIFALADNHLSMVTNLDDSHIVHTFEIVTDVNTFSFAFIASETYDPTDVSVAAGLGQPIPEPALLEGDANRDGVVSAGDYASVQANFGNTGVPGIFGDANGDGIVSAGDYASVQANFGNTASTSEVTPEPATFSLLVIGGLVMLRRKRKLPSAE